MDPLSSQKILTEQRASEPQGETGKTGRTRGREEGGEPGKGREEGKKRERERRERRERRKKGGKRPRRKSGQLSEVLGEDLEAKAGAVGGEIIRGAFEDRARVFPVNGC